MKNQNHFITKFLATLLLLLGMSALVFSCIDPRGMIGITTIKNINIKKFSFFNNETFIKPYQIIDYAPEFIITGNSIANTAFNLQHPFFSGKRGYSYGMAGSGIYTNYRSFQHIQDQQPHHVLHILDFSAFFSTNPTNNTGFIELSDTGKRLRFHENGSKNYGIFLQKIKDYGLLFFSWEIAMDSIETIRRQDEDGWFLQADGTWGGGSNQTGKPQRKRFAYVDKEIFMRPLSSLKQSQPFFAENNGESTLDYFEKYLSILYKNGTKTTLLIPPAHARVYETVFVQNRWSDYVAWKKEIVRLNEKTAKQHDQAPYPVWDFSGYSTFTTEKIPEHSDKTKRMQWFYDSVHIKPALGQAVMDVMTGLNAPENFGLKITTGNVDMQLRAMAEGHRTFKKTHPTETTEIYHLCKSVFNDHNRCTEHDTLASP